MLRKEAEREGVRREDAAHESRSRACRRLGAPPLPEGAVLPGAVDRLRRAVRRGLPRRKPDGEDHDEAPRRPGGGPGDPRGLRPRGRHGLQGRADARGGPALHRPGQAGVPAVPGNRAEQQKEPRARQAADRRWRVLAPGAAPRAHGALRRPRRRQRHPGGRPPRRGEDDRISRIRRARGRRSLDRRRRGAAAGAAPRQGQDGTVASLGAAHVEPGREGAPPGPHARHGPPVGRNLRALRSLDAAGQPLADFRRNQSAGAHSGAGGRRARHRSRRARGSRVRGAGAALRSRAGAGMRGRPAFGHPVPSRRREGRPARRGRNRERFDPIAWRRS